MLSALSRTLSAGLFGALFLALAGSARPGTISTNEDRISYLDNGVIRLGVNLDLGGAITYLSASNSGPNLINSFDWGRQIQMSHYSGPVPFAPNSKKPKETWAGLGWNPIQCGDCYGNRSQLLALRNTGRELYVKCRPMQWPLNNEPGECTFECWIRLKENSAHVRCRLVNCRSDKTQYEGRGQELPAVYTCAPWYRLMTYTNDRPFTHGMLVQITAGFPWSGWTATENWAALMNDDNFGVGIWEPETYHFIGGFAGKPGSGGPKDNPTGYLAPLHEEIIDSNINYGYEYTLVVGRLEEIRSLVYQRTAKRKRFHIPAGHDASSVTGGESALPPFSPSLAPPQYYFKHDRQHWFYRNTIDTGWPIRGELRVLLETEAPQLIGPVAFWRAEDAPRLFINAACQVSQSHATILWSRFGQFSFSAAQSLPFNLIPDAKFHTYSLDLSASAEYHGIITRLRFDPASAGKPGEFIRIKAISFKRPIL